MSVQEHAQQFASDNNAGICPQAWEAMVQANGEGHHAGYGADAWTARACNLIREVFEMDAEVFFVFNGTAANALSLAHICRSYNAAICHRTSHIETDECGAPEFFSGGAKLLAGEGANGKLTPDIVTSLFPPSGDVHHSKPAALSLTQTTEMGTAYSLDELDALVATARTHDLRVHMDGARFANAVAALEVAPADITWRRGIDVLSFGGTKNGLPAGEAVVFFDRELARDFDFRLKQAGQLSSKMWLTAAPWAGVLEGGAWLANARHSNAMARRLESAIRGVSGVEIVFPVEANVVFARLAPALQEALRARGWRFYTYIGDEICRLMCAWDTPEATVDAFAGDIRELAGADKGTRQAAE